MPESSSQSTFESKLPDSVWLATPRFYPKEGSRGLEIRQLEWLVLCEYDIYLSLMWCSRVADDEISGIDVTGCCYHSLGDFDSLFF